MLVVHNNTTDIDDYPYYSKIQSIKDIQDIYTHIQRWHPNVWNDSIPPPKMAIEYRSQLETYNNKYVVIYDDWETTHKINDITDLFTEHVRVRCKFGKHISPWEYWNLHKKQFMKKSKISIELIRDQLYVRTKFCNNFRITIALEVLNMFKPRSWLDISAGWGDRLLASIIYGLDTYVSADPNIDLHPAYNQIIQTFVPEDIRYKYIVYPTGFETAPLTQQFDLVFSSPPFFDLEKYSTHPGDSLQYTTESDWCRGFLWPSLIKAYNHLKKGGHMILYIYGKEEVMNTIKRLDLIMTYKGIIYFYDNKPRSMYVWKK